MKKNKLVAVFGSRFSLLVACVALIWLFGSLLVKFSEDYFQSKSEKLPVTLKLGNVEIRKGNFNGIPISVPSKYIYFPFEYIDKSVWEAPKPSDKKYKDRTHQDSLRAISVYVHWPNLLPRSPSTEISYWSSKTKQEEHSWLMIGVITENSGVKSKDISIPLNSALNRLTLEELTLLPVRITDPSDPSLKLKIKTTEPRYMMREIDPASGLYSAEPIGPGVEHFYAWNMALFWHKDVEGTVTDFVKCYNGKMPNPDSYQKCIHRFNLPEWGVEVSINYPRSWLSQWGELREAVKKLILSFQTAHSTKKQGELR